MLNQGLIVLVVIVVLILLIGIYWYYTTYLYLAKDAVKTEDKECDKSCKTNKQNKESDNKSEKEMKYGVTILSNIYNGNIQSRVMNLITRDGRYYVYCPNKSELSKQLEEDSKVVICNYVYRKEQQIQVVLTGDLNLAKSYADMNIYEFTVSHRKVSKTFKSKDTETTNVTFDSKEMPRQIINVKGMKEVASFIESTK